MPIMKSLFSLCAFITLLSGANAFVQPQGRIGGLKSSSLLQMRAVDSVPQSPKGDFTAKTLGAALKLGAVAAMGLGSVAFAEGADTDAGTYTSTDSGLQYKELKIGDGEVPIPGDTVRVHYTGWLDGFDGVKKFDSSYDRRSPLVFKAGVKQVIAGWDEALLTGFKVGGKRQVIIPAALGYGARGAGGVIPPDATLYFTMELVGIGAKSNR